MRLSPLTAVVVVVVLCAPAKPVAAQARGTPVPAQPTAPARDTAVDVPQSMMPPAGKCRIWMLNVPAKQQPAATDCTTAMRQKPANAVLVFGPALRDLSPFEVRESWARRASERDVDNDDRPPRGSRNDARGRTDSAVGEPARRVLGRDAESRRAEPPKADSTRKPEARAVPKELPPRVPAKPAKKPERP